MVAEIAISGLGLLVIYSGVRKVIRRNDFERAIEAYQPVVSARLLARGWALAEAVAGLVCLVPFPGRAFGLTWVVAGASGAVARRVIQGESHDCGCHGRPRPVSPRALVGNTVVLIGLGAVSFSVGGMEAFVIAVGGAPVAAGAAFLLVGKKRGAGDAEGAASEVPAPA